MREKFTFRIISSVAIFLFNTFINYLIVITLPVNFIGLIAFANSFIGFFSIFINLGFEVMYLQHNADDNFEKYFSMLFLIKSILIVLNFIPLILFSLLVDLEDNLFIFLILNIIANILIHFTTPWFINLESKLLIFKNEIIALITCIFKNTLTIIFLINIDVGSYSLIFLGFIYIISAALQLMIQILFSKNEFRFLPINKDLFKNYIKETRPLIIFLVISPIVLNLGKLLLDLSYGHEELAYYYFIDSLIIYVLLLISGQIQQIFLAFFPKEFKLNNLEKIEFLTHKIEKYSSMFFLYIIIFTFINGALLFELIFPMYKPSLIYLYILIFSPFLASINRPYTSHLIPSKRQKVFSKYALIKSIIFIFLTIIIVPQTIFSIPMLGLGGVGLAVVSLSSWIIDTFVYRYYSKKIGINYNKKILIHILSAFITLFLMFLLSLLLNNIIHIKILFVLFTSIISLGIFLLTLFLFREFKKEDFDFIISLFKLSNYKNSFLNEIKNNDKLL